MKIRLFFSHGAKDVFSQGEEVSTPILKEAHSRSASERERITRPDTPSKVVGSSSLPSMHEIRMARVSSTAAGRFEERFIHLLESLMLPVYGSEVDRWPTPSIRLGCIPGARPADTVPHCTDIHLVF
jgi:hypothetical protein